MCMIGPRLFSCSVFLVVYYLFDPYTPLNFTIHITNAPFTLTGVPNRQTLTWANYFLTFFIEEVAVFLHHSLSFCVEVVAEDFRIDDLYHIHNSLSCCVEVVVETFRMNEWMTFTIFMEVAGARVHNLNTTCFVGQPYIFTRKVQPWLASSQTSCKKIKAHKFFLYLAM